MALHTKKETTNNYEATLTNAPGTIGTTLTLSTLTGLSTAMSNGTVQWYATVVKANVYQTSSESPEIVLVTGMSGSDATVTRAQFSTTALDLAAGDYVAVRPIAYHVNELQDILTDGDVDINVAKVDATSLEIANDGVTVTGILDQDDMSSNSATKLATQQSIKAYVDTVAVGGVTYKGGYDASGDPNSSAFQGDMYTVTVAGTGAASYWSNQLEIGDVIIAETDNPASESDWSVVQVNVIAATTSVVGVVRLANTTETTNGTDDSIAVTPDGLADANHSFNGTVSMAQTLDVEGQVSAGNAAVGTVSSLANDVVISASSHSGMTVKTTQNNTTLNHYFNENGTDIARTAMHTSSHASNPNKFIIGTMLGNGEVVIQSGNNANAISIDSSQNTTIEQGLTVDGDTTFAGDVEVGGGLTLGTGGCNKTWSQWVGAHNGMWTDGSTIQEATLTNTTYAANRREPVTIDYATGLIERAYGTIALPEDYDGTNLICQIHYSQTGSDTDNFQVQFTHSATEEGENLGNNSTHGGSGFQLPASGNVSGTGSGIDHQVHEITFLPTGGSDAAGQLMFFSFLRIGTTESPVNSDTLKLIGIKFYYE